MTRLLPPLLPLLALLAACRPKLEVVLPDHLAVGDGATAVVARPQLDIVVRMTRDSTGFNPFDLMQLVVNGTDEAPGMVIGGNWAVFTVPAPGDATFDVALNRRVGTPLDAGTIVTQPYAGPTLASVTPDTAATGSTVTLSGGGFAAGALRVFFGGVEGAVAASDDTTISAVVPADALPGLVWVLVGDDAAEGIVGFQPLDGAGAPVPAATNERVEAAFPAAAPVEAVIRLYGRNFDDEYHSEWGGTNGQRILNRQVITVSPIGEIVACFAIAKSGTPARTTNIQVKKDQSTSNHIPFVVLE